jgi:hypothetical protein
MGCKQSKQVRVQPVGAAEMKSGKLKNCMSETDAGIEPDINDNRRRGNRNKSAKNKRAMGSSDSLDDGMGSDRGGSAGSKKSHDSGLGDLGEYNQGFITEYSDPDKVKEIENQFKEREDLGKQLKIFYIDIVLVYTTIMTYFMIF